MSSQVDFASLSSDNELKERMDRQTRNLLRTNRAIDGHGEWLQKLDDEQEEQKALFMRLEDSYNRLAQDVKQLRAATLSASSSAACCVHCEVAASDATLPVRNPFKNSE
jgi:archaellum component FlaC